jgi:DNA mismatch endonuclease (patch repair protein)
VKRGGTGRGAERGGRSARLHARSRNAPSSVPRAVLLPRFAGEEPTDVYDATTRSEVMRRVKGRDTGPEREVRRLVRSLKAGYRLNRSDLPGKPDLVFQGRSLVVFVHGCFWHGHDCARGARTPKANRTYWTAKIDRNRARDASAANALLAAGWRVETIWECELKDSAGLARRLKAMLDSAPPPGPSRARPAPRS